MLSNKLQWVTIILKDLNKFPTPQIIYNQMWLNLLMDDCHFSNIANIIKSLYLIISGKINICNFSKIGHILHLIFINYNNVFEYIIE
jgi:hypothetical protein